MQEPDRSKRYSILRYSIASGIVVILMAVFTVLLFRYMERSIHNERRIYLATQTSTASSLIIETMSQYSNYAGICASSISRELQPGTELYPFLDAVAEKLYLKGARMLLVDRECTWYSADSTCGRITAVREYENDTPDSSVYMTTGVDVAQESMVFRVRLPEPIPVTVNGHEVEILYCAAVLYMDMLQDQLAAAVPYTCNRFILDENGLMLYRKFDLGILLNGSNVFSKYSRVDFLFGDSGYDLLQSLQNGQISVGEFSLKDTRYFICTAPLQINNWYMSYVLESDTLNSGSYLAPMVLYISGICLLLAIAIMSAVLLLLRIRSNRQQLEVQRQANVMLEQASNAKTEFLSNMSHDIRTPINGIMGMTMLAQRENNPPKTQDCLQKIDSASRHLLSLVNDVLDMSSIESGKITIAQKPVHLPSLLQNCLILVQGQLQNRKLRLITEFASFSCPNVLADELHIRRVLQNILSNAVKYTPDGGTIWFRAQEVPAEDSELRIRFQVEDTGLGMKPDFLEHIWDRFSQEDGGSRTDYKGTGLGMSITKRYVDLMGGTITVTSEYEHGSVFTVELPFARSGEQAAAPVLPVIKTNIRGAKILLVEDNPLNMTIARELLEDEGAVIAEAENGQEALDVFRNSQPDTFDMILMDIMMPVMNGLQACRAIRSLDRNDARTIPIIAMTANAFEEDIQNTRDAGMNAHLSKPIDLPSMLQTLSAFYHGKDGLE